MKRVLLLVLLLIPVAAGQSSEGAFLGATYDLGVHIDPATMETPAVQRSGGVSLVRECSGEHLYILPGGDGFGFTEESDDADCAEARFNLTLPADAREHRIQFRADRNVRAGTADLQYVMKQDLHLYGADEASPQATRQVYAAQQPTQTPRQDFSFLFETAPERGGRAAFGFYFEDAGSSDSGSLLAPPAGASFSATVTDLQVVSMGIPLDHEALSTKSVETSDAVEEIRSVALRVTPVMAAAGDIAIHLSASTALDLVTLHAPDGREVPSYWLTTHHEQGVADTTIDPEAIKTFGAGTYTATFRARSTFDPDVAMVPLAAALFFLPVVAGVVADRAAGGLIRAERSPREGGRTSVVARWLLIPTAALYVSIVLWVVLTAKWQVVMSWPLVSSSILVYGGLLLSLIAFLVLGYIIKRDVNRHLLQEKRERQVLNEALQAAVTELERSNLELENFAYAASHDLQEPLRKIVNYNQLLNLRYRDALDDEGKEFLSVTVDAGKRMQTFIRDLLEYSRIGADEREPEIVDVNKLVAEILDDLEGRIETEEASVECEGLPMLRARHGQLRRVFQNLIANALNYRHPDRAPRIHIRAEDAGGDKWRITVEDNGMGVKPKDTQRVFEPFRRGRSAPGEGSGIGLALCKRVVERHGGAIGVEPSDEGSRFWFTWPKVPANGMDGKEPAAQAAPESASAAPTATT